MSDLLWSDWHIEEWIRNEQAAGFRRPDAATAMRNVRAVYEAELVTLRAELERRGAQAAEQLARAVQSDDWNDLLLGIHNAIVTMGTYARPLEPELMNLTTTQWDLERAKRIAAAVLARLHQDTADGATPHPAQSVASGIAIAMLQETLDRGESVSIPSLGIVIRPAADGAQGSEVSE